jgi:glycosyltransferase 2 family protein
MRWRAISIVGALLLGGYFVFFAWRSLDVELLWRLVTSPTKVGAVLAAATLYASIIPISAWAWRKLLSAQGERWSTTRLTAILGVAQIAKYVPGNLAQHVARATYSMRSGMGARAYFSSVIQESILAVAASLIVGTIAIACSEQGLDRLPDGAGVVLVGAGIVLAVLVPVLASVHVDAERARSWNNPVGRTIAFIGGLPGYAVVLNALAAYSLNYLLIGAGLWLVALTVAPADLDFALVTAAFSLAWALGFFAPGSPAGLGVREGAMLFLLQGGAPNESITLFVLLARVVTMLGDGICYAASSFIHVRTESSSA